ncbi:MAG: hypothetical protein APF77_06700 [Clostridia bacterium BRH_c25]|nr:MAG: hypothetical protein APF77_06700 [Clostridia bacterium BRH_c25]
MKRVTPFSSSGRGPAILRNCILGAFVLMLAFKQKSIYMARNSSGITEIIAGLFIILFSLYDSFIRKEKNTVWGIPTWFIGGLILIMGTVSILSDRALWDV